jgi:hypothetical protein
MVAPSSKLSPSGILTHSGASVVSEVEYEFPASAMTRSPTLRPATAGPIALTTPVHSTPRPLPSPLLPSTKPMAMRMSCQGSVSMSTMMVH